MKRLIVTTFLSIVFTSVAFSQTKGKIKIIGSLNISKAYNNGVDITEGRKERNSIIYFFIHEGDSIISMSNYSRKYNTNSTGPIFSIEYLGIIDTVEFYNSAKYKGGWNYHNSYDSDSGFAWIEIFLVYSIARTEITLKIHTDKSYTLEFKGDLDGSFILADQELTDYED